MEKLICSACGAPLLPDTSSPFITCEYCDTTIENRFYVEPAVKKAEPVTETVVHETEEEETQDVSGGSLLKTILGVGTAIAANSLRRKTAAARRPVVRTASFGRASGRQNHQRALPAAPHRHPEPPRTGSMGARPVNPGAKRPSGGMRGPGMRGPGGRHR